MTGKARLGILVALVVAVASAGGYVLGNHFASDSGAHAAPAVRTSLEEKLQIARTSQAEEAAANSEAIDPAALKQKQDDLATEVAQANARPTVIAPNTPAGAGFIVDGARPQVSSSLFIASNDWFLPTGDGTREWSGQAQAARIRPRENC